MGGLGTSQFLADVSVSAAGRHERIGMIDLLNRYDFHWSGFFPFDHDQSVDAIMLAGTVQSYGLPPSGGGIQATSGNDTLVGTAGNDTISGLGGDDTISGLAGNDILAGNAGADTIDGGDGNDTLYSGDISPAFTSPLGGGSWTPPLLDTGTQVDTLKGGAGDDTIFAGYGDNVDGGDGYDTLYISFQGATAGIHFDMNLATQVIGGGTITGIEDVAWLQGSNYDDYVNLNGISGGSTSYVFGMGGDDTIIAGYSTSYIDGGDGNDILDGRASIYLQEIDGGAGDDTIHADSLGLTTAYGGDGNDTIYTSYQAHGGAGNDTIVLVYNGYSHTVTGDAGDDVITGSAFGEPDVIQGNDGNDTIHGGGGDDVIDGGAGMDIISGDAGNDTLTGCADNDTFLFGQGDGSDTITDFTTGDLVQISGYDSARSISQSGGNVVVMLSDSDQITFLNTDVATVQAGLQFATPTDDTLIGGAGNDDLRGYGGNDTIIGNGGDDILAGGSGSDTIDGGDGNDFLFSGDVAPGFTGYYGGFTSPPLLDTGSEVDTITGGAGDDVIFAGYGDNVDGGPNDIEGDKLFISFQGASAGVHFDAHLTTQTIGGGTITGIENISWVQGSNYDDYIDVGTNTGNGYSDFTQVYGMGGNDTLIAGYYTAVMDGGDGNDIVDGRNSQYLREVDGGAGDDTIYTNPNTFAVANGGDGNDTIYAHGEIHGGAGDDIIHVVDSAYPGPVTGDDGNDTIYGSDGADHLDGGAGDDVLTGGAGNDVFVVGIGNDVITDFSPGDKLEIHAGFSGDAIKQVGSDVIITLSTGDTLKLENTDVATVQAAVHSNANDIAISNDGSTIYAAGNDGNLYAYSAATGALLYAWHVGNDLGGMDISPDGGFAIVTDLKPVQAHPDPNGGNGTWTIAVYKVDLTSGAVTTYTYNTTSLDYVFHDAAILANGDVLLSQEFGGSGPVATRLLDPSTGIFTTLNWEGEDTVFSVNQSGSYVLAAPKDISDGPLMIYRSGQGVTATHDLYQDGGSGFNDGVQAISENGQLIAQAIYGDGLNIYNAQLNLITNLAPSHPGWMNGGVSGLAFDPSGTILFVLDNQTDKIVALSTTDWSEVAEFAVGSDVTGSDGAFGDRLLVAPDMSYFVVQTGDGSFVKVDAVHTITGTSGIDTLNGTNLNDTISGLDGNDVINGLGGNDTIDGGAGDDMIAGGAGADTLTGGGGNDTFIYGAGDGSDTITDFAAGDVVKIDGYGSAQSITQVGSNVVLAFASGDQITFDNTTVSVVQSGLHFDVQPPMNLTGTAGADTLIGGTGNDHLSGLGGNDILNGGPGNDVMVGGSGNDTYYVDSAGDTVTELAGQGTDTVHSTISYTLPANVERGILDGTASLNLTGNALANMLQGNSGDNFLYGGAGNDTLIGGAGNDTLRGGVGADTLTGGAGSDIFEFEANNGNDKVTDFVSGTDKLDFHLLGITSANVTAVVSLGNTLLRVDANHDGTVDFTITLVGVTHVVASDYIFT